MKKLKVKLLTGRSGTDGSYVPGDKVDLPISEAITLIASHQAEPVNKQAYEVALKHIQIQNTEDEEKQAQLNAKLHAETLELELKDLYRQVALKTAEIEGVVLNEDEVAAFINTALVGEKFVTQEKAK